MDALGSYTLSDDLWVPQRRGVQETIDSVTSGNVTILYSPTGGGKTRQAIELFHWANHHGWQGAFYLNRRLLIPQTSAAFSKAGLWHGVRAADYDLEFDADAPFQICSSDTEASRVIDKGIWQLHDAQVVVVDEAHLQRTKAMEWIIKQYKARGAYIVLLTATPVNMKGWADHLVVSGSLQEYRDCKALVMAVCKGISSVDLSKVNRSVTGEFIMDGKKKKIYTQTIVGDVIKYWQEFNPDARPAMAYWPGKPESLWGTQQFEKIGVRWAHVDANDGYIDGERYRLSRAMWNDIMGGYKDGSIKGISSRFKCLDLETEILTRRGWLKHDEMTSDDLVYQTNMQTGETAWEKPLAIVKTTHTGTMYSIKSMAMDARMTDDHGLVVRSRNGCTVWKEEIARDVARRRGEFHVPVAVKETKPGVDLSNAQLAFIGWFMTDGTLRKDTGAVTISQSTCQPDHYHEHIKGSIVGSGLKYTTGTYRATSSDGTICHPVVHYRISKRELVASGIYEYIDKDMHHGLIDCTEEQLMTMIYAMFLADGSKLSCPTYEQRTFMIAKGNTVFLDRLQALCVTNGWRCNIHDHGNCHHLYFSPDRHYAVIRGTGGEDSRVRLVPEQVVDEPVWCVTTRLGTIVTRRHGKVLVQKNCREGVDAPDTYHIILATPIGSLASYIQTVGRGLRYSEATPDNVIITDHGGCYQNHGSPNHDRPWQDIWQMSEHVASKLYRNQIKSGKKQESIVCVQCKTERPFGDTCPSCGLKSNKRVRRVVMENGTIIEHEGRMIHMVPRQLRSDTERLWTKMYHGYYNKPSNQQTFAQMEAFFAREYRHYPPRDLPFMPKRDLDWYMRVKDVPRDALIGGNRG